MSYSIDVNVLLRASNSEDPHHAAARRFLERCPEDPDLLCLAWPTLMGYLRISTHPSVFTTPLTPEQALANLEGLLGLPRARVIHEAEGFLAAYREVTGAQAVRGNMVPDAHLATLLRQHGVRRLYTADAEFRRFPFLDVLDPFAA